jgi:WD40 repeat protein
MRRFLVLFALFFGLCNLATAQEKRLNSQYTFRNVKISAAATDGKDKNMALGFSEGKLVFYTIFSDKFRWFTSWPAHTKPVCAIAFCPDCSIFASAGTDGTVKFWDYVSATKFAEETEKLPMKEAGKVPPPSMTKSFKAHTGPIVMTFSPDSKKLVTAGTDGVIKIWNVESPMKPIATLEGHKKGVNCLEFNPDGTLLASGGEDKAAKLWRFSDNVMEDHVLPDHDGPVLTVAFSADGKQLAIGSGVAKKSGQIKIWEAGTGKEMYSLPAGHEDVVTSVCFHPKEPRLISGSKDKTVRIWDLETKKELYKDYHVDGLFKVLMTVDGRLIGTYSPEEAKWWLGKPRLTP